jgi:hypothetical protein
MSEPKPSLLELKQVLESAPLLRRLGFHYEILGLHAADFTADLSIELPSLISLSLCHTLPSCFLPFISILHIPHFSDLTVALDELGWQDTEDPSQLLAGLHSPLVAPRLEKLTIQSLSHPCDPDFFAYFCHLKILRLDFSLSLLGFDLWKGAR